MATTPLATRCQQLIEHLGLALAAFWGGQRVVEVRLMTGSVYTVKTNKYWFVWHYEAVGRRLEVIL